MNSNQGSGNLKECISLNQKTRKSYLILVWIKYFSLWNKNQWHIK